jgi:hypothetical protein
MHALLSLPVIRKFIACGSGAGNVSGVVLGTAVVAAPGFGAPPTVVAVVVADVDVGESSAYVARGAATKLSLTRLATSSSDRPRAPMRVTRSR